MKLLCHYVSISDMFMIFALYVHDTIWLFNIAMENSTIFHFGKPSSMDHCHPFSMAMLVITRGYLQEKTHRNSGFSHIKW